jgi:membrane protease YdiL (CAAX protease family)
MNPALYLIGALTLLLLAGSFSAWVAIVLSLWFRRAILPLETRQPVPWTGFDVLLLAVAYIAVEVFGGVVAGALAAGGETLDRLWWMLLLQPIIHAVWFLGAVLYLAIRGAFPDDLGFDLSCWKDDVPYALWMYLAALIPVYAVQAFFTKYLEIPSRHPLLKLTGEDASLSVMILATIAAVGVAPWFEEFIFRVVLQGWLEREQVRIRQLRDPGASSAPGYTPLVVASLLFAALHAAAGPDPFAIFFLSLFLGYVYRQTHRMLPSVLIHTGVNGFTMFNLWGLYLSGAKLP